MFSILVSELTPDLLEKAEWWAFVGRGNTGQIEWKDNRIRSDCTIHVDNAVSVITAYGDIYLEDVRCFPVTLAADGTETRLECPQMPDEVEIEEYRHCVKADECRAYQLEERPQYWRLQRGTAPLGRWLKAPTPNHYPRRALEGTWVWSTRR